MNWGSVMPVRSFESLKGITFSLVEPQIANGVRPGAAGLLIGIEYSRLRDSSWMYLTSLVTI